MVRGQELEGMTFFSGLPQPTLGDGSAVSCSQCDDRFHEHCVYITPKVYKQVNELEEPWIFSHWYKKRSLNHS